jgi:hypothetical protein
LKSTISRMLKILTKAASNTHPGKKGKYKNQDKHRWRKVAAWVIPFLIVPVYLTVTARSISGVWLAVFTWVAFFFYFTLMLEWLVWRESGQRRWLRIVCALLCGLVIGVGFVWRTRTPQPFSVVAGTQLGDTKRGTRSGVFWATYKSKYGDTMSPAQLAIFIEIVNLQPVSAIVRAYKVEAVSIKTKNWIKLIRVDVRFGDVFFCFQGQDPHHAKKVDTHNALDYLLPDKTIPSHDAVRGWAFFELPEDIDPNEPIRITVEDASGMTASQITSLEPRSDYIQTADLNLAAEERDISGYYFRFFSDPSPLW